MTASKDRRNICALSVSIVTHHSDLPQLERTLISLHRAADGLADPLELILVDQSLCARYARQLEQVLTATSKQEGARAQLIISSENRGFGAGHNQALKVCRAPVHLILNPDVEFEHGSLSPWLDGFVNDPEAVLSAPIGFDPDGTREYLAKDYPSALVLLLRAFAPNWLRSVCKNPLNRYELRHLDHTKAQSVPLASGCCMLIKRQALDAANGFDERYFLYFEDYDLCQRLSSIGQIVQTPMVRIVHHGGNTAGKGLRHIRWFCRSALRFFHRWGWRWF